MGSSVIQINCPNCGKDATQNDEYKDGNKTIECEHCGYNVEFDYVTDSNREYHKYDFDEKAIMNLFYMYQGDKSTVDQFSIDKKDLRNLLRDIEEQRIYKDCQCKSALAIFVDDNNNCERCDKPKYKQSWK